MNKFITLALIAMSAIPMAAAGTDHLTGANFKAQLPDLNYSATGYADATSINPDFTYEGESGAKYLFNQMVSDGSSWWALSWANWPEPQGYVTVTESAGYLTSMQIKVNDGLWPAESFRIYLSNEPILTEDDIRDCVEMYLEKSADYKWEADGLYRYFRVGTSQEYISDLEVSYSETAPAIKAKTPTIDCWDKTPEGTVWINTQTSGALLHITTFINSEEAETTVSESSSFSMKVPGVPGDNVKIEAYASMEGYEDSEVATMEFTVEKPVCPQPVCDYWGDVWPGAELVYTSDVEGAYMTYIYGYTDWNDRSWESEMLTADFPVTITVPGDVLPGDVFYVIATAHAEGYADSSESEKYLSVISTVLDAPSASIQSGTEVKAGTELTLYRPKNASAIHYVVNDGEEVTVEDEFAHIVISEDCSISTWATGEAPFTPSETVMLSYTVEKFNPWTDVLTPSLFCTDESLYNGTDMLDVNYVSKATTVDYVYHGALWIYNSTDWLFYLSKEGSILYNNSKYNRINRIKIDSDVFGGSSCYVLFSDAPVTEITEDMKNWDFDGPRLRIGKADGSDYGYDEWIDLQAIGEINGHDVTDMPYFAVWRFGQNGNTPRIVVDYEENPNVGVNTIDIEESTKSAIYTINGIRVDSDNLTPGIYIRKSAGKAEKFIVR